MEKYARQAIAEGVKTAEEIKVSTESELYRVLNLHYNRNNQIEVRLGLLPSLAFLPACLWKLSIYFAFFNV